jgi:hypothetical protein
MMDYYVDIINQLQGFLQKHVSIEFSIFIDEGQGIRGVIDPGDIIRNGPVTVGRDFFITVMMISEYDGWQELFEKMGIVEDKLNRCFQDEDQKVQLQCETGTWSREQDESNLIYSNDVTIKVVRTEE